MIRFLSRLTALPFLACFSGYPEPASAGTTPEMPLLISEAGPDGMTSLQWDSVAGQLYQLERRSDLAAGVWLPEGDPRVGTGKAMFFSEERQAPQMFYRLDVSPPLPTIGKIAFMGDSITEQGSIDLVYIMAYGYMGWARVFGGSRWDLVSSGTTYRFATGGKRSDQVSALHRAQVIASDADVCVIAYGTNDAFQGVPASGIVNQAVADWTALRAAGIEPVATTVLPMASVGGENGERQALVADYNVLLRAAAAEHGVALCDWTTLLEAVPGSNNGIGLDAHFTNNDNLHPNPYAASLIGRELNATLKARFTFGKDLWENDEWITLNVALAGTGGQPGQQWSVDRPSGGTINGTTLEPSPEGNWWRLDVSQGTSGSNFMVISSAPNIGGSAAGKKIECVAEVQVESGSLAVIALQMLSDGPIASDLHGGMKLGGQVTPADGLVVLRTPVITAGAGVVTVKPVIYFMGGEGDTVIRIRRCGVRVVE